MSSLSEYQKELLYEGYESEVLEAYESKEKRLRLKVIQTHIVEHRNNGRGYFWTSSRPIGWKATYDDWKLEELKWP